MTRTTALTPRRRLALAVAAALVVASCDSDKSGSAASAPDVGATVVTTTPEPAAPATDATTSPPKPAAPAPEQAAERAEAYLAAFASRDSEAMLDLHADDFVMRIGFPGDPLGEVALFEWFGVVHQAALGTVYAEPDCVAGDDDSAVTVVECDATMVTTLHEQTNTPGVPSELTITFAPDGVASLDLRMIGNLGLFAYYGWRELQDPPPNENPTSVQEAIELGTLDAQFADEYATFGVAAVEELAAAFNAADLDAFLARFESETAILGVRWTDAPDVYAALMAADQRYELEDCGPAGISGETLAVECQITVLDSPGNSGIEPSGTITAKIAIDGRIRSLSNTIDWAPGMEFRSAFKMWLAEAHPEVHDPVRWLLDTIPSADDYELVAPYYDQFIAQSDTYPVGG